MGGNRRLAMAAGGLLAVTVALTAALAQSDADKAEPPPAVSPATPALTFLNKHEVEGVLGREVRSATDENMGRIVDVLVDRSRPGARRDHRFRRLSRGRQPQDRGGLECIAFSPAGQAGRPHRARTYSRPSQSGARISGRQAGGHLRRPRQARTVTRINNNAGDAFCPRNHYAALTTVRTGATGSQAAGRGRPASAWWNKAAAASIPAQPARARLVHLFRR